MDTTYLSEDGIQLLKDAQGGSEFAEEQLILLIRKEFMAKRIGRYMHRNRQVEDEDLRQEFMIGVALAISKARIDMGDPIQYLIGQGMYRVRSYVRKHIIGNTMQTCNECGNISRLNRIGNDYICKKCGSNNNTTEELNEHNEIVMQNIVSPEIIEDDIMSQMTIAEFEKTLKKGTNVHSLYLLLNTGIRHNPHIDNYIKEIAKMWGGCSEQNIIRTLEKLQEKLRRWASDNGYILKDGYIIQEED